MVVASYKSDGATYSVVQATMSNVKADMEYALQDGVEVDDMYKARMEESVRQGLAYRITKSGKKIGVMYNAVIDGEYVGCSIYCKGDRVGMLVLMKSMFEVYDWHKIKVIPHNDESMKDFVSMATAGSILKYHEYGMPLVIARKDVVPKGEAMFKYMGIKVL